jgi:hypothetical protein
MSPAPHSGARTLAVWVMAVPLMAMGLVAVVMPPALSYSLLTRGADEGQTAWVVFGALTGLAWLAGSYFMIRRAVRLRRTPA